MSVSGDPGREKTLGTCRNAKGLLRSGAGFEPATFGLLARRQDSPTVECRAIDDC
jgi:hypothetical protein